MSFVSGAYLLLLPLTAALCRLCPRRWRHLLLLGASLLFYMGWSPALTLLLAAVALIAWASCLLLERRRSRPLLALCLAAVFIPLLVCKYAAFALGSLRTLTGWPGSAAVARLQAIALPVGISFYTFQAASCLLDVWRGELKAERNPLRFTLFVAFFPQLVAGPIERGGDLMPQLRALPDATEEDVRCGLRLLLSGFFRKVCAADGLAPLVDRLFALERPDGLAVLAGAVLFGFQVYHDFAGYSEIALGSARLLGVRLSRNFDRPFAARSVHEFWRRWHITLSGWFRACVYRPLCGPRPGRARKLLAASAVFLLSGLWHGAAWTFVAWGAWHAALYVLESLLPRPRREGGWRGLIRQLMTFLAVSVGWIFFRAEGMAQAAALLRALVGPWSAAAALGQLAPSIPELLRLLALPCAALVSRWAWHQADREPDRDTAAAALLALAIALCWLEALRGSGQNAFIYFQF